MTTTHYDDPSYSYESYWQNRDYEHSSEVTAINRFLSAIQLKSHKAADLGGGYGRLTHLLTPYFKQVLLVEPSRKQRRLAEKFLRPKKKFRLLAGALHRTHLKDESLDLAMVVRVMHHIRALDPVFAEFERIIAPQGYLILEFANSTHLKARLKSLLTGLPILPIPLERRSPASIKKGTIDFLNHHPYTIRKQLRLHNFQIIKTLSVSNFRFNLLKQLLPLKILNILETLTQIPFGRYYLGPSIFILAQKVPPVVDNSQAP